MKTFIRASALSNAIFVCLLISIFSGCLVLISHYQSLLNYKLEFKGVLINTNNASFEYYLSNPEALSYDEFSPSDIFENDIITYSKKKKWGFYDILMSSTVFKNDTINKIGLVGTSETDKNFPALFVTNYDKPLKLSGQSKIIGISKVPNGFIEQAYINGPQGNAVEIRGQQFTSEDKLPKITSSIELSIYNYEKVSLDRFKSNEVFNSFLSKTIVIDISGNSNLSAFNIKGNIILYSTGTVTISNSTKLTDIVLFAKNVVVESGFKGNLQIISENDVILERHALLEYPSSIFVKNDIDSVKVHLKPFSKIAGGIVIEGDNYINSLNRTLIIDKEASVYGSIYCYGSTQLEGEVIGHLFTDRFFLKTQFSDYENVILNGTINSDSLPKGFVQLPLFITKNDINRYELIKKF